MNSNLCLYMVAPIGYEHLVSTVIASSPEQAVEKAKQLESIRRVLETGVDATVLNLTEHFSKRGYDITITHRGMYH